MTVYAADLYQIVFRERGGGRYFWKKEGLSVTEICMLNYVKQEWEIFKGGANFEKR